jgi:uncharacterized delta-60 repeat protein
VKTLFDHLSWVQAVAVQTDGKIVVVGAGYENYDYCGTGGCLALARYNPDGSVDTGFGQGGTVITDIGFEDNSKGNAVVLQSDGKIVVAGSTIWSGFVLARYNSDGSLDNGFGNGGYVTTSFSWLVGYPSSDYRGDGRAVALQADGKIVVAGLTNGDEYVALARYNNNGSLDTGFGNGGRVMSNFGYSGLGGYAIKLQSDGKIIVAGACIPNNFNYDIFFLGRFNPDGSVDTSFGSGGTVATDFSGNWDIEGRAVVLQADGKIVVAGFYYPDTSIFNFALARYNSDGSLDTGFGSGGRVTTDFFGGDAKGSAAALLADGKIVVAGSSNGDFALALYNSNGSLDNGFGNGGKVTTDFGGDDEGYAVALQTDGKILVAGSSYQNYIFVALARYVESEPTPTPTPTLTVTPTSTPTPSATSTPEKNFIHLYLPVIVR